VIPDLPDLTSIYTRMVAGLRGKSKLSFAFKSGSVITWYAGRRLRGAIRSRRFDRMNEDMLGLMRGFSDQSDGALDSRHVGVDLPDSKVGR